MDASVRSYLARIGAKGGRKSRRVLSSEAAREMVKVREARRAFRRFYVQCFWSCDPELAIARGDVGWVAEQLLKQGGREAWTTAEKLCR